LNGPSRLANDNVAAPSVVREGFGAEELVATRRRLKLRDQFVTEGAVGRVLRVRSAGRLYDVCFAVAGGIVVTVSRCDIARWRPSPA